MSQTLTPDAKPLVDKDSLYHGLNTISNHAVIKASLSYYVRLIIWVGVLFGTVTALGTIPRKGVASLKAVVCFTILLVFLIILKSWRPGTYESFRWICTPGNVFLRSWISLFFYVYLVRVPADLAGISGPQILSWIFQCTFGNIIALFISGCVFSLAFAVVRLVYKKAVDVDEFDVVDEIRKSQTKDTMDKLQSAPKAGDDIEMFGISEHSRQEQKDFDIMNPMANSIKDLEASERFSEAGVTFADAQKLSNSSTINSIKKSEHVTKTGKERQTEDFSFLGPMSFAAYKGSVYTEVDNAIGHLGMSFALMNDARVDPLPLATENLDSLTIERVSCMRREVVSSHSSRVTLAHVKQPSQQQSQNNSQSPEPFLPNMNQLFLFWFSVSLLTGFVLLVASLSSASYIQHYVITFQFCITITVFIGCSVFRAYLKKKQYTTALTFCQAVIMFFPVMLFIVIATSTQRFKDWKGSLTQYLTSNSIQDFSTFGAGDLLVLLLAAAISSLAFSTVDAIVQFHRLMPLIIPTLWVGCVITIIQAAFLSWIMQTPSETGLPLLLRTITTPVAVAIAEIINASTSITAASSIINGMTSYICAPYVLNFFGVLNPVSRGCSAALAGTLLGVLAMDEKGETAAGIGMAAYGLSIYAITMGIDPFQKFAVDLV